MVAPVFLRPDHSVFRMKALTLYNPWAWFVIKGLKRFETRSWRPNNLQIGDLFVIHAGKRFSADERAYCQRESIRAVLWRHGILDPKNQLPFGSALGIVKLISVRRTEDVRDLITSQEQAFGNFANKRFAWELEVVKVFEKPVSMPGAQGIFTIEFDRNPMLEVITGGAEKPDAAPIFVDDVVDYGPKGDWCHLWTDGDRTTLDAFAHRLGLKTSWAHQSHGTVGEFYHYDLRPSKRDQALKMGAVHKPLIEWIKEKRPANDAKNMTTAPAPVRLLDAAAPLIPLTDDELKRDAAIQQYDLNLFKRLDETPAARRRRVESDFYQRYIRPAVVLARSLELPLSYPVGVVNGEFKRCYDAGIERIKFL